MEDVIPFSGPDAVSWNVFRGLILGMIQQEGVTAEEKQELLPWAEERFKSYNKHYECALSEQDFAGVDPKNKEKFLELLGKIMKQWMDAGAVASGILFMELVRTKLELIRCQREAGRPRLTLS